jgi:acetyltransferase-like isoleucine patch superfamily enzyme
MKKIKIIVFKLTNTFLGFVLFFFLKIAREFEKSKQLKGFTACGENLHVGKDLSVINRGGVILIGHDVSILNRCLILTNSSGSVKIGNNVFIADNVKVCSENAHITIGNDTMIADDVAIRASNHGIRIGQLIRLQEDTYQNIKIGNDVWIGSGVKILAGSVIEDGCVIAANSVVNCTVKSGGVYGGVPVRKISDRT